MLQLKIREIGIGEFIVGSCELLNNCKINLWVTESTYKSFTKAIMSTSIALIKGQLILKENFDVFKSLKKLTNFLEKILPYPSKMKTFITLDNH